MLDNYFTTKDCYSASDEEIACAKAFGVRHESNSIEDGVAYTVVGYSWLGKLYITENNVTYLEKT